ncbi:hypothetical protein Golax_021721 [Gossypium laxum]|uniref:Uncharacterized protein n=1 Tax=Gossypium laxum TaxID=34288 RepID=A0A7J9ALZ9_9ROSI|nr:hypothetical protein [Gossypium laxum]
MDYIQKELHSKPSERLVRNSALT